MVGNQSVHILAYITVSEILIAFRGLLALLKCMSNKRAEYAVRIPFATVSKIGFSRIKEIFIEIVRIPITSLALILLIFV